MTGSRTARGLRIAHGAALTGGLILWVVVPLLLLRAIRTDAADVRLRRAEPASVPVLPAPGSQDQPVGLHLEWKPVAPAVSPAWSGLVDAVTVRAGDVVHDGDSPLSIDRGARVLVASRRPFTRPLAYPMTGADVVDLNAFLDRHGYHSSGGDRYGAMTETAVKRFGKDHGLPDDGIFRPEWTIFLPQPDATVTTVAASVGAPAPAAGEPVLTFDSRLDAVRLIGVQTQSDDAPPATDGTGTDAGAGGAELAAAEQARLAAQPTVDAPRGAEVVIDRDRYAVAADHRTLAAPGVAALARTDDPSTAYLQAALRTRRKGRAFIVPTAAIFADPRSSSMCVLAAERGQTKGTAITVVDDQEDSAVVAGPLRAGDRVIVGVPADRRSCR